MAEVEVAIERLPHAADLPLPAYATAGSAGLDLMAAAAVVLEPGGRAAVPTGLRIALPEGVEAQVRPRSGLALRHGVTVLNAPGTIDADYRGEIQVILVNHGRESFAVERGQRVAQLVLAPVLRGRWQERPVDAAETVRGAGGFGSTGTRGTGGAAC
ncbi:MAG: dUTP diphosphatase [Geminicoccaceae bacterium]